MLTRPILLGAREISSRVRKKLKSLNGRLEALYQRSLDGERDPALQIAIDALESEAALLIQARSDATLKPVIERHDAAMAEARRLLGRGA